MQRIRGVVLLCFALVVTATAQQSGNAVSSQDKPVAKKKLQDAAKAEPAKPKLTPDQELGYQTLELAESQARGLEPPMRSYSLLQIAAAYTKSDPAKARKMLQDSFSASLAIQDDDTTKRSLQMDIFPLLLPISQSDVEERLTQAEPAARQQAAQVIIRAFIQKKQFGKAIDMVQQVTSWDEFPYTAALQLLDDMPADMTSEKQALFASAVASYRAHEHKGMTLGGIENLIARFGPAMPPKLAL